MTSAQAHLGILMLDSQFPRILGDVGNPRTWDFPVRYEIVTGATPASVVLENPAPLLEEFVKAGHKLVAAGCSGIATTCGFLAPMRQRLADSLGVPVAASALEQAAGIQTSLPSGRQVGVLTIARESLGQRDLEAAAVPKGTPIAGVDTSDFARSILGNSDKLDVAAARRDICEAAVKMRQDHPTLGAILLECTNMVPYAPDVARAAKLPVYSIYSYLTWFHAGLVPASFPEGARNQSPSNV
ncbi:MAG: aspartate/glutamate racemase family protein [Pseudomonadota bacterium]